MIFTVVFLIYFLLPIFLGLISNILLYPRKIVWYRKKFRRLKLWTKVEYSAAAFFLATGVFFIVGALLKIGVSFSAKKVFLMLGLNFLTAIMFLYYYWGGTRFFIRYKELIKFLIAPIVIVVTTFSKIYSDAGISELSGLAPKDLPGAQLFLTLILTPVIWLVALSLALGYSSLLLMPMLLAKGIFEDYRRNRRRKITSDCKNPIINDVAALVAVFLASILLLNIMQKVVSKSFYEPRLRQAIEFSSFHLPTTYCGLPEIKGASVAPVSDDKAALAIFDAKAGYKFIMINCKPKLITEEEVSKY